MTAMVFRGLPILGAKQSVSEPTVVVGQQLVEFDRTGLIMHKPIDQALECLAGKEYRKPLFIDMIVQNPTPRETLINSSHRRRLGSRWMIPEFRSSLE